MFAFVITLLLHCIIKVNTMAMVQDCFKLPEDLINRCVKLGKKKSGGGKSSIYRMAIIEYLEKYEEQVIKK